MMENKDILSKVMYRADEIKLEKANKKRKMLRITSVSASLLLIIFLGAIMPTLMNNIDTYTLINHASTGTIFSNSSSIGYIVMGVISFILGIIVTLVCYKIKEKSERK